MTTEAGKALVPFEADTSGLLTTIAGTVGSAGEMFGKMVPLAIIGSIAAAGAAVVDLGSKYASTTDLMAANAGITIKQANLIGSAFLATGGQTTFTAQEMMSAFAPVAGQLEFLNGSALSAAQSVAFMTAAMHLAEATGQPLSSTVKDLTNVMMAFKIPVDQASAASDTLYNTSRALGIPLDSLTTSLQRTRTAAGAAAPSLGDLSAFLLDLAANGETGRGAVSLLGTALTGIETPTAKVTAAQKALGLSFLTSNGQLLPLKTIIGEVNPIIAGMGNAQATATLKSIGFGSASSKLVDLMQAGVPAFTKAQDAVDKTGTAAAGAAEVTDNLSGSWDRFKTRVIDAATSLGMDLLPAFTAVFGYIVNSAIPAVVGIVGGIGDFITKAGLLVPILAGVATWMALSLGSAAIGAAIAGVTAAVGALLPALSLLAPGFAASAAAALEMDTALDANPIGLIIAAIAALVAGVVLLVTHFNQVKAVAGDVWNFVDGIITTVWNHIKGVVLPVVAVIQSVITVAFTAIKDFFTVWWSVVSTIFTVAFNVLKGVITVALNVITGIWNVASTAVKIVVQALWDTISQIVQIAVGVIELALHAFAAVLTAIWQAISAVAMAIWNSIKGWLVPLVQGIGFAITLAFNTVKNVLGTVWSVISTTIRTVWGTITTVFTTFATTIGNIFNGIRTALQKVWTAIGQDVSAAWNGIVSVIKGVVNTIISIIDAIIGGINKVTGAIPFVGSKLQIPLIPQWHGGGGFFNRPEVIGVGEAGPEVVLNRPQVAALMGLSAPSGGSEGGPTIVMHNEFHAHGASVSELIPAMDAQIGRWHGQALALARAKGRSR